MISIGGITHGGASGIASPENSFTFSFHFPEIGISSLETD